LRLVVFVGLILLGIFMGVSAVQDHAKSRRYAPLDYRGIITDAKVLSYNYDPDGGDPGGWTRDHVSFMTRDGQTISATVGHHDPGTENTTGTIRVIYDPLHPRVVLVTDYDIAPSDGSNWPAAAIFAGLCLIGVGALGSRIFTWKPLPG